MDTKWCIVKLWSCLYILSTNLYNILPSYTNNDLSMTSMTFFYLQMLGIGICNIVVGVLKDNNKEANPESPACCSLDGNATACFDTPNSGSCQDSKYGSCSDVSLDGVDYANSCQQTNYSPMLNFFTSMAAFAVLLAMLLKYVFAAV